MNTQAPTPSQPTEDEIAAGARALATLDGADYFDTGNANGIADYTESARAVLNAALPLVETRIRRQAERARMIERVVTRDAAVLARLAEND